MTTTLAPSGWNPLSCLYYVNRQPFSRDPAPAPPGDAKTFLRSDVRFERGDNPDNPSGGSREQGAREMEAVTKNLGGRNLFTSLLEKNYEIPQRPPNRLAVAGRYMAAYDSDSSGAEDDYTETNVLLGYAAKDPSDDTISHLGGRPTWPDRTNPPPATLAKCKVCKDLMVLLLQLNGDLPEYFPGHERRLYVLTCRRKTCRRRDGSVRVLRGVWIGEPSAKDQLKATGEASSKPPSLQSQQKAVLPTTIGESLFGVKPLASSSTSNPFSTSTSSTTAANPFKSFTASSPNPFSTSNLPPLSELAAKPAQEPINTTDLPRSFAAAVSLNIPPTYGPAPLDEPWPQDSDFPPPYPLYYLVDADYETLDKLPYGATPPRQKMEIDEEGGSGGQKEDKDAYESTIDKTFQKFADRLAQNPEQVIRYEFKGHPLLYSKSDAIGKLLAPSNAKVVAGQGPGGGRMPRCENCGAARVFEVQLTPHAITELEADDLSLEGMEWGTIIVGVCEKDCLPRAMDFGKVGYAEEWAGVQWEEVKEKM